MSLDERLVRVARTCGHSPAADRAVARFSMLGEHAGIWLAVGGAEWLLSKGARRARWRRATATVAGTYAANTALKLAVRRVRPRLAGLPPLTSTPTRYSFPSAHSSTSFAAALAFGRSGLPSVPLYTLAKALALSRLYLGVHYPSDIAAGALLGTAIAALFGPPARSSPGRAPVCARANAHAGALASASTGLAAA
ncbi:MAG TPA: phosphatase PAP2 family protein [Solirubrobacteraceae bacterium]|jgi:undecaprenyl-diphosphatase